MALGVRGIQVVRVVIRDALTVSAAEGVLGLLLSWALSPLATSLLYGTSLFDPAHSYPRSWGR
jgi:hypothetical protein